MTKYELKEIIKETMEEMEQENQVVTLESLSVEDQLDFYKTFYEAVIYCEQEDEDDNEEVVEEGANMDIRAELKSIKVRFKTGLKEMKKCIKSSDKSGATAKYNETLKAVNDAKSKIDSIDSSVSSAVFGYFTSFTIFFAQMFLTSLIPILGNVINFVKGLKMSINQIITIVNDFKAGKPIQDCLNMYKNTAKVCIDDMIEVLNYTKKHKIDKMK